MYVVVVNVHLFEIAKPNIIILQIGIIVAMARVWRVLWSHRDRIGYYLHHRATLCHTDNCNAPRALFKMNHSFTDRGVRMNVSPE